MRIVEASTTAAPNDGPVNGNPFGWVMCVGVPFCFWEGGGECVWGEGERIRTGASHDSKSAGESNALAMNHN